MALVDPGDLLAIQSRNGARELGGAEIAAVTEGRREVAFAWTPELGFKARQRPEVARPVQPVIGVIEDVDDIPLRHPFAEQGLQLWEALGQRFALEFTQDNLAVLQARRGISGKRRIRGGGEVFQPLPQGGDKHFPVNREANLLAILFHALGVVLWRDELGAIITERLAAFHIEIAGL